MTELRVIGVDPGPVPGIVVLHYRDGRLAYPPQAIQATCNVTPELVISLLKNGAKAWPDTRLAVEQFVSGRRAARSSTAKAGKATRDLVGHLEHIAAWEDVTFIQRNAGQVKPWATDTRLAAVKTHGTDLLDVVSHVGRHARDAARHALFCAVKDGGVPDPLSRAAAHQED